ncbi:MAG: DNA mismatch repair protein MutS, partial [Muribaculaceae bacterium]|nr:DNA mismatch repair protein MutS [Muribaculaceae bacterium]
TRQICQETITVKTIFNEQDDWIYTSESARERLLRQFDTDSLKGFGIDEMEEAVIAAGSLMHYLDFTQHTQTRHITSIARIDSGNYLYLDKFTMRNLEILAPAAEEGTALIDVLDHTVTPMGARMLRNWIAMPLLDIKAITDRQNAVEDFFRQPELREELADTLRRVGDLYRLAGRLSTLRIQPREMLQLAASLDASDHARALLSAADSDSLRGLGAALSPARHLSELIRKAISPDAPANMTKGNFIADGYDAELDRYRHISRHSREALDEIQRRESEATGIPSLKISFNNVHGYYIEVRNTHKDKVPADWTRRQTLVGAERYITPELKEYENTILGAEDKINELERRLYLSLIDSLTAEIDLIIRNAVGLAKADCLLSMAICAEVNRYVRPVINDSMSLKITDGRHPVIEHRLPPGETYVANSVTLDCDTRQIMMITGPNMSGKSALLRQTALIVLMAQTGSFIPAASAEIGLTDKIMTRVGASDNISAGESTFMVEMNEAASILNNMSPRSLILFDELGRGTSTYDGISIAWAIVEHIHENGRCRPKTLFATHYHELNEMEKTFPRIANFNVSVSEIDGKVVFMRKLRPGGSEHSFGIHVARLAGMPRSIVKRADQVLKKLEEASAGPSEAGTPKSGKADVSGLGSHPDGYQLSLFQLDDPLLSQIRDRLLTLDIDNLTPLQALTMLHDLKGLITGK